MRTITVTLPVVDSAEGRDAALTRIRELWLASDGTPEADERETLATLVRDFDARTEALPRLPPVELVRALMERLGHSQQALVPVFGSKGQVSDFLSGRRPMTITQALRMREAYHVPLDLLIARQASGTEAFGK